MRYLTFKSSMWLVQIVSYSNLTGLRRWGSNADGGRPTTWLWAFLAPLLVLFVRTPSVSHLLAVAVSIHRFENLFQHLVWGLRDSLGVPDQVKPHCLQVVLETCRIVQGGNRTVLIVRFIICMIHWYVWKIKYNQHDHILYIYKTIYINLYCNVIYHACIHASILLLLLLVLHGVCMMHIGWSGVPG